MRNRTEGESLGWFDHVRTLMTRSVSIIIIIIIDLKNTPQIGAAVSILIIIIKIVNS